MAQEGIYKNPIILNKATHKSVKISRVKDYKFTKDLNSVLLAVNECMEAAKSYPIVFIRNKDTNEIMPLGLLGLRQNENLFIDQEGNWKEGSHIPIYFRRYPFILADSNTEQSGGTAFAVSVDADYEGFDADDGMLMFDEAGEQTQEFSKLIESLKQYQTNFLLTKELIKKLDEFNLLKEFSADITMPAGEKLGFRGLMMVDEQALLRLEDNNALELYRKGFLAWIYAHLYSLSNFRPLAQTIAKAEEAEKADAVTEE